MTITTDAPVLPDVEQVATRIAPWARRTPTWPVVLDGQHAILKLEHLQLGGSFKLRGALAALTAGPPPAHVVAASGGNHGVAVATAAALLGVPATIVVPSTAPAGKTRRIEAAGAELLRAGDAYADAARLAGELADRDGWLQVPAFDDAVVVAGQAGVTAELVADHPEIDTVAVASGGGGLAAGACLAAGGRTVVSVEPERCCSVAAGLAAGAPVEAPVDSVAASGLGASRAGALPLRILADHGAETMLVPDSAIVAARDRLWDEFRLAVEPAGATAFAALSSGRLVGRRVGVVVCGANTDWTPA